MAANKSGRSKVKVTERIEKNLIEESSHQSFFPFVFKKNKVLPIIIILLIAGFLVYFRSLFVVAIVNGEPITRFSVIQELEKQSGKQTLQSLVTKTLILQEAKKENVTVDNKEVDAELEKAKQSLAAKGQKLEDVLAMQGLTLDSVKEQIRIQKLIEKMISKDITVSDAEVNDYIDKNKDQFQDSTDSAQLKESVKTQLIQQKTSTKFQSWIADLQKKAQINYFLQY